jgi:drug/metabolite transporter (DMT)-like permease
VTQGILLSLLAASLYGLLGVCYEAAGKRHYNVWDVALFMQLTGFVIGLVISGLLHSFFINLRLLGLGIVGAITFVASLGSYLMACRQRDIGANWTIVNLSVILPILFSVLWFHDTFSVGKVIAVILTVLSILIICGGFKGVGRAEGSFKWIKYIGLAFFFNAWLPILLRFVPKQQSALFTTYLYGAGFVVVLIYKFLTDSKMPSGRGLMSISVAAAGAHWSGMVLTIMALAAVGRISTQAGIVVYPITNGLVIPLGVLLGVWILKEKIYARTIAGVALGVAALVFLSVG